MIASRSAVALSLTATALVLGLTANAIGGDLPQGSADLKCNGLVATKVGTDGPDTINGTRGPDVILGLGAFDKINGGGGHDTICGDQDVLVGVTGNKLTGGKGFDTIIGAGGPDTIDGGPDIDIIYSAEFEQPQSGDRFPSVLEEERNTLNGGGGEDFIFSGMAGDALNGGGGNDHLFGGDGRDAMSGGQGSDELAGEGEGDFLFGGPDGDKGAGFGLFGGLGPDEINGGGGSDFIDGGADADPQLKGGPQKDEIHGGPEDDSLFGEGGEDHLFGEGGNDHHNGGPQDDVCEGGGEEGDTFESCNEEKEKKRRSPGTHALNIVPGCTVPRIVVVRRGDVVRWTNQAAAFAFIHFSTIGIASDELARGESFSSHFGHLGLFRYDVRCIGPSGGFRGFAIRVTN